MTDEPDDNLDDDEDELDDDDVEDDDLENDDETGGPDLPDLAALFGGGGMPDLGSLVDGLASIQDDPGRDATRAGPAAGWCASAPTGAWTSRPSRSTPARSGDGTDLELLADLVLAALHDLTAQIAAAQQQAMGPLGGMLGP